MLKCITQELQFLEPRFIWICYFSSQEVLVEGGRKRKKKRKKYIFMTGTYSYLYNYSLIK